MLLKRSVSPDGKIDALSIEFTCVVNGQTRPEVTVQALKIIGLQEDIARRFKERGGRLREARLEPSAAPIAAELLDVCGMDTAQGRILYLRVQTSRARLRAFGSREELADMVAAAGYPEFSERVQEGVHLNLPCRITTKLTRDGRYLTIEHIMPVGQTESGS